MGRAIESATTASKCRERELLLTALAARLVGVHCTESKCLKSVSQFYLGMASFFKDAPVLSWSTYWLRQFNPFSTAKPKLLTRTTIPNLDFSNVKQWSPEFVQEYADFLREHHSPSVKLNIPAEILKLHLEEKLLGGAEYRTPQKQLVGVVVSRVMGNLNGHPCGLITWLCVHPAYRKQGIARKLLFAIEQFAKPITVFLFRNDGWLKSLLPPVYTQQRVMRPLRRITTQSYRISEERGRPEVMTYWTYTHPTGLVLSNPNIPASAEYYRLQTHTTSVTLVIQPTFEQQGARKGCEVLAWVHSLGTHAAPALEALLDTLPYDWVEAPADMPREDTNWTVCQPTSWCLYGYDPGTPVQRPILPLVCA